jgi:Cu/Ag efflux pump CusA
MWLIKHYRSAAAAAIHNRHLTVGGAGLALALIMVNVAMAPICGLLALLLTHTNFSVSSGVGFLALFGVSVQTGVIMLEYINQLRVQVTQSKRPPSRVRCFACAQS